MTSLKRILLFFVLPIVAILMYPPDMLIGGWAVILVLIAFMVMMGWLVNRGRGLALTFLIFLQGMNVIIRLMMFASNSVPAEGVYNFPYMIASLLGLALSFWLMLRLDQVDVRATMTS